jgi:hypothetical protein
MAYSLKTYNVLAMQPTQLAQCVHSTAQCVHSTAQCAFRRKACLHSNRICASAMQCTDVTATGSALAVIGPTPCMPDKGLMAIASARVTEAAAVAAAAAAAAAHL